MSLNHQWTTFQKGRLKVSACACCGDLKLPGNTLSACAGGNYLNSPLVQAGYSVAEHLPRSIRTAAFSA